MGATSIAFPAISTGIFGYPPGAAAEIALTSLAATELAGAFEIVRVVAFDESTLHTYRDLLDAIG